MKVHYIDDAHLSIECINEIINEDFKLALSKGAIERIKACRTFLDEKLKRQQKPIYGINTGFGSLCNVIISDDDLEQLQENLVMSHACGVGEEVPTEIIRIMILLKVQGLSYGYSGVQLDTVLRLIDFFNEGVLPVIYQQGSLGASGDLAPLAHMSLALLGKGDVRVEGELKSADVVYKEKGWAPIRLKSKEGLALINGTQFMSAFGVWNIIKAKKYSALVDQVASISLDAFDGRIEPFSDLPHLVRKQPGQLETARVIRTQLEGSEIMSQEKLHVQDPYSFRCIPQVHGASKDVISFVEGVFTNEINSVTDNPTIFKEEDQVISAGNFHGQPLAMALDQLAIAVAELGSISERRTYKLISGERGLPSFLVKRPGLNSGFMIPQYTAASIVSQNKQLCMPASVDTIDSSNGQEDHVSMGANAATKCYRVVNNLAKIIGIELFNASQGITFREPLKTSPKNEEMLKKFREHVPIVEDDIIMRVAMAKAIEFVG